MPFQSKGGGGDGVIFGRITEEVEELTLPEAGGKARRFDTFCGNVLVRVKLEELKTLGWRLLTGRFRIAREGERRVRPR